VLLLGVSLAFLLFSPPAQRWGQARTFSLALGMAQASLGLDPSRLNNPASYDSRPCAHHPSSATCNGIYPVTPPAVSPAQGRRQGAGACIDERSWVVEEQTITDAQGQPMGHLQLRWMPTCTSYYGTLSFTLPPSQIRHLSVWAQSERYGWWEQLSQQPPFPTHLEQSGPVSTAALGTQELYSPLLYSPAEPVSAGLDLELTDGTLYGKRTASYATGIQQYRAG
jgi:hypothetical protein